MIATRVGGISEVINTQNGFLIEPKNEGQLSTLLEQIINKKPVFNPQEIQETAKARFNFKAVGKQINMIYKASF